MLTRRLSDRLSTPCSPHFCAFESSPGWRDFESVDSGYCGGPCEQGEGGANCRKLAAGCGASVADISGRANGGDGDENVGRRGGGWGDRGCDKWEIEEGECDLCREPLWCDDPGSSFGYEGSINSPERWMDEFFDRGAPGGIQHRPTE